MIKHVHQSDNLTMPEAKFRDNSALGGFAERCDEQVAAAWALEEARDVSRLMGVLA